MACRPGLFLRGCEAFWSGPLLAGVRAANLEAPVASLKLKGCELAPAGGQREAHSRPVTGYRIGVQTCGSRFSSHFGGKKVISA